jgi:hypothetical protein
MLWKNPWWWCLRAGLAHRREVLMIAELLDGEAIDNLNETWPHTEGASSL